MKQEKLTGREYMVIHNMRKISSHIKSLKKHLFSRKASIILPLFFTIICSCVGAPLVYSLIIKHEGDNFYINAQYVKALETYQKAKNWWILERVSVVLRDRDLDYKIGKSNIMIKSDEYYRSGLLAFSEGNYRKAISYFSHMAERDPNIADAQSKIEESNIKVNLEKDIPNNNYVSRPEESSRIQKTEISLSTYPIITLGEISGLPEKDRKLLVNAYNEFLQTPNLIYMDTGKQNMYLRQIIEKYIIEYKEDLKSEIEETQKEIDELRDDNLRDEVTSLQTQINPEIESKLRELRDILGDIQNQPVSMDVLDGKLQKAYQNWINENSEIYNQIRSSFYNSQLNTILSLYGL